jgi:CO dehydrogenase maturation factor
MTDRAKPPSDLRIGVFGKGGSGKSTVTVLLARALRRHGHEVCVLDADSTNVGLHRALGLDKAPSSLVDYYGGMTFSGGAVSCPVDDPTPLAGAEISIAQLPAEFVGCSSEGIRLLSTGKMGDRGPGAGCDGPMAKIARDLRLAIDGRRCLTVIDFKAGFEDSARGVLVGLDWVLVVVDPTLAALEMAAHMRRLVAQIQQGVPPATAHLETPELVTTVQGMYRNARIEGVLVVVNRVDPKSAEYLHDALAAHGIRPAATLRADESISRSWLEGNRLEAARAQIDVEDLVKALEISDEASELSPLSVPIHPQVSY